jgi:DNA-binding response OmpR family regulator
LVVEDDPLVRDTIVWELQDAGYVVIEATTGEAQGQRTKF